MGRTIGRLVSASRSSYEGLCRLGDMASYEERRLQSQYHRPIPKRTDGSGVSWLMCKTATAEHFGFDKLDRPKDQGVLLPSGQRAIYMTNAKFSGANTLNLRIAYAWTPGRKKPDMVRIRIGGSPVQDTLQVLTNILNESGKEWLWLTNKNGNRLSTSCFHSVAV